MLPTVDFCGLKMTRLLMGANPFGGFSHQNAQRNEEMVAYNTPERIQETWERAWAAGINTFVTNNETPHVIGATQKYIAEGGPMQWIAQVSYRSLGSMQKAIDQVVEIGCKAMYFHGALADDLYAARDADTLKEWVKYGQDKGIPIGSAGHADETHYWMNDLDILDFHTVCFFDCGSLHNNRGDKFQLGDIFKAAKCIQTIEKPCIGYKIMGAGRIDAELAFEYAFDNIKPGDVVNVGMHRGDNDNMVEENVALVEKILAGDA
ncbi:MAG: hypothetical protein HN849_32620 [Victivallales bacterium]|nr:hypothetical protein [Victivallales bacterium]